MELFRKRKHLKNEKAGRNVMQMVTTYGEHYYSWDGKLYNSDIVRACIRPKVKAAGKLAGKPVVFLGHRRGARRLFVLLWTGSSYSFKTIDDDCGAANVYGYSWEGKDRLIAANREINQIARYSFEDGDIEEGLCLKN